MNHAVLGSGPGRHVDLVDAVALGMLLGWLFCAEWKDVVGLFALQPIFGRTSVLLKRLGSVSWGNWCKQTVYVRALVVIGASNRFWTPLTSRDLSREDPPVFCGVWEP